MNDTVNDTESDQSEYHHALITYVQAFRALDDSNTTWTQASTLHRLMDALSPLLCSQREHRNTDVRRMIKLLDNAAIERSKWISTMFELRSHQHEMLKIDAYMLDKPYKTTPKDWYTAW